MFSLKLAAVHLVMSVLNRGGEIIAYDDKKVRAYVETNGEKRYALLQPIDLTYDMEDESDDDGVYALRVIQDHRKDKGKDIFLTLNDSHDARIIATAFVASCGAADTMRCSLNWLKKNFEAGGKVLSG